MFNVLSTVSLLKKEVKIINMVYLTVIIFVLRFFAVEYQSDTAQKNSHCDIIVSLDLCE